MVVRNRIYNEVFDKRWVRDALPRAWYQAIPAFAWALIASLAVLVTYLAVTLVSLIRGS